MYFIISDFNYTEKTKTRMYYDWYLSAFKEKEKYQRLSKLYTCQFDNLDKAKKVMAELRNSSRYYVDFRKQIKIIEG